MSHEADIQTVLRPALLQTSAPRPVLAIDPGPVNSAWVVWNGESIQEHYHEPNEYLLLALRNDPEPGNIAIEMIACYGMAVGAEVFETCVWIGRFMEACGNPEDVIRVPRLQIKMHLCHSTRANDSNIRQALIDRLGAPGTKKAPGVTFGISKDKWAALALAVCVFDRMRIGEF